MAIAEKYFSGFESVQSSNARQPFSGYVPRQLIRKYSRHQAHAVIGNTACSIFDERRYTMSLLNNILGGPAMNSRLNIALREKNGIAYNLESNYQAFSDTGLFSIYCGTDDALMPRAIELIHIELSKLRDIRLSPTIFHTALRQLKGQIAISLESHQNEMLSNGKSMIVYGKVDPVEEIYRKIDSITSSNLQELANEVFALPNLSTLIFNNQKSPK